MKDLNPSTATGDLLPFAPLTLTGLGVAIEEAAMRVTHAVTTHRATDPAVVEQARLVLDMCRARRARLRADIAVMLFENFRERHMAGAA